jgi:phosphoglycerol transferase MdoB-like AlkP superfamily enzyme
VSDDLLSAEPRWRNSRFGFACFFLLSLILVYSVLRLVLFVSFRPETPLPTADVFKAVLVGFHLDFFVALTFTIPILSWILVVPNRWFRARWHRVLWNVGFFLFAAAQVFSFAAEFFFFEEFKSRFNTVAVDYLLYPHEVFINIQDSYPVGLVVAGCGAAALVWLLVAGRLFRRMWEWPVSGRSRWLHWTGAVALWTALLTTVSLKQNRFSNERILNELANNGAVAFVTAAWTHHLDFAAFYKTVPPDEAYQRARRLLSEPTTQFVQDGHSLLRRVKGDPSRPKLNVVIFLEESFGSEFWGSLGRKGETLTPEMDRLATEEGMLFTNIYASGNRTVRGFEGVLSSFPPLPGDSIVKRDLSGNVETIARVLKRDGYSTIFLYGGRGVFDGMRSFAVNNGYDRFVERKHFENPTFTTIWGVCDEDLYQRSLDEIRDLAQTGRPFFATVLSVSNHKPYTYPKGRIPEDPDQRRRENAVKYSDYALGQFFQAVKKESYYTNTIFVVVADHGARVYGSQSIPIHSYEIPLVIVGPAVIQMPSRIPHLGGSLDVAPTVLGLVGRPYESLFFGRDLLNSPPSENRVYLNHNRDIGLYRQERLVVLGLGKTSEFYQGNPKSIEMTLLSQPGPADLEIETDAIALFQVADDLYVRQRYRID